MPTALHSALTAPVVTSFLCVTAAGFALVPCQSLRDHFAGLAMQKIIDSYETPTTEGTIAREAYRYADAMLEAREAGL